MHCKDCATVDAFSRAALAGPATKRVGDDPGPALHICSRPKVALGGVSCALKSARFERVDRNEPRHLETPAEGVGKIRYAPGVWRSINCDRCPQRSSQKAMRRLQSLLINHDYSNHG